MHARWITASFLTLAAAACSGGGQATETPSPAAESAPVEPAALSTPAAAEPAAPAVTAAPAPAKKASSTSGSAAAAPKPSAPTAPAPPKVEYRTLSAPAGTTLTLELLTPLDTGNVKVEAPVKARLKHPVTTDSFVVLPAGTELSGTVTEAQGSGRVKGRAHLAFAFNEATVAGAREKLRTAPLVFDAKATKGQDAAKIGIGAAAGAVIGGIAGGGDGAAKGAAIGGGAGTGLVLATKGEEVKLEAGTELTTTLADPYEIKVKIH
jgi:hypothetical protein